MGTKTKLDKALSEKLRDAALQRVEYAADPDFKFMVVNTIETLALNLSEFTTDDIWSVLGEMYPREPRVLGALVRNAAIAGKIETTDRTQKSLRASCHRRPVRVWRSCIFKGRVAKRTDAEISVDDMKAEYEAKIKRLRDRIRKLELRD